ncbi:MAG: NTP transferase domain-containing protein [candidate division Zixibacteria bacterium]|nr:NTP transferase domain-containing protein [candidate division Zixibacteria bacterium]MCI0595292.1 NTP transferase domain-containing protein [candidate division Zixibacteria bacterium]
MKVVIPVAGEGTRMRPLTDAVPKPLLEVAGEAILGHLLRGLEGLPVEELIFVVGFKKEMIVDYVRARTKTKARFVAQDKPAGLGYAVNLTLPYVERGPLLILLGDTVLELDWKPVLQAKENLLGLKEVDDPKRFGIAIVQNGKIAELEEKPQKPKSRSAIVGPYFIQDLELFKKCLADLVAGPPGVGGEWQITDGLANMIKAGAVFRPLWIDGWFDCGKPETLLETNRHLLSRFAEAPSPSASLDKLRDKSLGTSRTGSTITPPCFIASSAVVESSTIGPFVSIGERAAVRFSSLRNSIISARTTVNRCTLEDSIIGAGAVVNGQKGRVTMGTSSEVSIL